MEGIMGVTMGMVGLTSTTTMGLHISTTTITTTHHTDQCAVFAPFCKLM
ncbi:hypothetical protein TcasGA2_TC032678 [Tribolium castaneum]|uniref:Uncharacterized protein n=1 Tax=Tribolium castaneum TaxID=7070 RepID=A0A139WJX0_TRICA|nr:hypothetical protein TcasGA2_TC032678 [Tribolium castaneum]